MGPGSGGCFWKPLHRDMELFCLPKHNKNTAFLKISPDSPNGTSNIKKIALSGSRATPPNTPPKLLPTGNRRRSCALHRFGLHAIFFEGPWKHPEHPMCTSHWDSPTTASEQTWRPQDKSQANIADRGGRRKSTEQDTGWKGSNRAESGWQDEE